MLLADLAYTSNEKMNLVDLKFFFNAQVLKDVFDFRRTEFHHTAAPFAGEMVMRGCLRAFKVSMIFSQAVFDDKPDFFK